MKGMEAIGERDGDCRLVMLRRGWLVVDLAAGRGHVCRDRAAAVALVRMINRPLDPRLMPTPDAA